MNQSINTDSKNKQQEFNEMSNVINFWTNIRTKNMLSINLQMLTISLIYWSILVKFVPKF